MLLPPCSAWCLGEPLKPKCRLLPAVVAAPGLCGTIWRSFEERSVQVGLQLVSAAEMVQGTLQAQI